MNTVIDIANFILAIIGAFGGVGGTIYLYRRHIKQRRLTKFFPLLSDQRLTIVCPVRTDRKGFHQPEIPDDVIAATLVATMALKSDILFDIISPTQLEPSQRQGHLFLICGPIGNSLTKEVLEKYSLPLRFGQSKNGKWQIVDEQGKVAHPPQGASHDYALVAKVRNPWVTTGDVYVYVAAGIGRLGTQGAVRFLCEDVKQIAKRLHEKSSTATCFVGIVECRGDYKGLATSSDIITIIPL